MWVDRRPSTWEGLPSTLCLSPSELCVGCLFLSHIWIEQDGWGRRKGVGEVHTYIHTLKREVNVSLFNFNCYPVINFFHGKNPFPPKAIFLEFASECLGECDTVGRGQGFRLHL
jgi:hypothetical protein